MPDTSPIARSPIAPTEPIIELHGWEVSGVRSDAELRIIDATPLTKIGVRAATDGPLAEALAVPFGRSKRASDGALHIGSGPGEWLVVGAPDSALSLRRQLEALAGDAFATVIDLSSARALMRITGERAHELLAKLCAIDLADAVTPNASAFRSSVAGVVSDVIREDEAKARSYWIHCEWSSGQYLFDACLDAGAEFNIERDGLRFGPLEPQQR